MTNTKHNLRTCSSPALYHGQVTPASFDGLAIKRIGPVVYSVDIDTAGNPLSGPWAICDRCGILATGTVSWAWDDSEAWMVDCFAHECEVSA